MPLFGNKNTVLHLRLSNLFESAVFCRPDHQAFFDVESKTGLTFAELSKRVNQLARFLIKITSVKSTENVAVNRQRKGLLFALCMTPSPELIISLLAILKLEAAYVPIDVTFPISKIEHILIDSKPDAILINGLVANLQQANVNQLRIIDFKISLSVIKEENYDALHLETFCDDPLFAVIYTSGSTGTPKGVKLGSNGVLNWMIWQCHTFPYSMDEVVCYKTAFTFLDSISEIHFALLSAHKLLIIPTHMVREVEQLVGILEYHKVERIILVPSLLRSMLFHCSRTRKELLPHLRLWICSGEVFSCDLLKEFFRIFPNEQKEICNVYGCTEVLANVIYASFKQSIAKEGFPTNVPIGIPISNSDVYLVNENMEEVTEGTIGEIMIAGKNLCQGYYGLEISEKFIANPFNKEKNYDILYRTGDYGILTDGLIYFQGRVDSQIKIRGHRINLIEVENCLHSIEGVDRGHVLCYLSGQINQALISFYTSIGSSPCRTKVISELERLLPSYMVPQVYKIDDMPLLVNGKIDRQHLLSVYQSNHKDIQDKSRIILDSCPDELKELAAILLHCTIKALGPSSPDCISLDDNYLKIGGNSLNILLVLQNLQDIGYFIGIKDFTTAINFREVLSKISSYSPTTKCYFGNEKPHEEKYKTRLINSEDIDEVFSILSESFTEKSELEKALGMKYEIFRLAIEQIPFGDSTHPVGQLSFLVYEEQTGEIVGVSVSTDSDNIISFQCNDYIFIIIMDFIDDCEHEATRNLHGIDYMHSILLGTKNTISTAENVKLVHFMELNIIEIARRYNYDSILTTNTSTLTQQMCQDVFNYTPLRTFQANLWVAMDGTIPFADLSDSLKICVDVKYL